MRCLNSACDYNKTEICDTRRLAEGRMGRRRRWCYKCKLRYTTLEIPIYTGPCTIAKRALFQQILNYFLLAKDPYKQWQALMQALQKANTG